MIIEIRLKKLLAEYRLDRRGIITEMSADLGIHRHVLKRIYANEAQNPSLKNLGMISDWLHAKKGVPSNVLPQALFGAKPSALLQALAGPGRIVCYIGEFRQGGGLTLRWVSTRDAFVYNKLVQHYSDTSQPNHVRPELQMR